MKKCMKAGMKAVIAWIKKRPFLSAGLLIVLVLVGSLVMAQAERYPMLACSPCHVMDPYVEGYHGGELLSHKHQEAGVTCIDCHENGIEDKVKETVWYVTDDFDDPPVKRDFGNAMCTKCHTNMDEIVAKTDKGNGVNPHDSHLGDLHCADCHKMHAKSKAACQQCHDFDFLQQLPAEWQKVQKPQD